jgi:hypothetical protein
MIDGRECGVAVEEKVGFGDRFLDGGGVHVDAEGRTFSGSSGKCVPELPREFVPGFMKCGLSHFFRRCSRVLMQTLLTEVTTAAEGG